MRRFADEYGIPGDDDPDGAGRERHDASAGLHMLGMHGIASANYAVEDCDFLIAIGARFDDRVAGDPENFAPNAKNIAHFDVDIAEIGKVKRVNWHHVGVLARDLDDMLAYGSASNSAKTSRAWHEEIADLKSEYA